MSNEEQTAAAEIEGFLARAPSMLRATTFFIPRGDNATDLVDDTLPTPADRATLLRTLHALPTR